MIITCLSSIAKSSFGIFGFLHCFSISIGIFEDTALTTLFIVGPKPNNFLYHWTRTFSDPIPSLSHPYSYKLF